MKQKLKRGTKVTTPFDSGIGLVYHHDTVTDYVDVAYPRSKGVISVPRRDITVVHK